MPKVRVLNMDGTAKVDADGNEIIKELSDMHWANLANKRPVLHQLVELGSPQVRIYEPQETEDNEEAETENQTEMVRDYEKPNKSSKNR